ncbi:hypothetical protein NS226_20680 [Aureimonas ureilytica]|uniref:Abasic site processing protein n=1 Tax=Aureimonas ureilytica TaxID=401562 RepID=A0A175R360_9HYPH|nr:SOS response-associated peptidase [Aureimonas ureilytica]KTQ85126.1 hypothetical protein NS226_20680 [Aureimonas ureilytica]
MCGRFTLTDPPRAISERFLVDALEPFPPRYNIAPTQPVLVLRADEHRRGEKGAVRRIGHLARWGLIPSWTKDPSAIPLLFNARSETAHERNSFKAAFRHRRCLVPASGFYEWRRDGGRRGTPFFVRPTESGPIAFAGLCETYLAPDGSEIDTATILTISANADLREIHERMPIVIAPGEAERWLDCRDCEPRDVADLLSPAPEGFFEPVPVSDRVNAVANMGPEVQERADQPGNEPPPAQGSLF